MSKSLYFEVLDSNNENCGAYAIQELSENVDLNEVAKKIENSKGTVLTELWDDAQSVVRISYEKYLEITEDDE